MGHEIAHGHDCSLIAFYFCLPAVEICTIQSLKNIIWNILYIIQCERVQDVEPIIYDIPKQCTSSFRNQQGILSYGWHCDTGFFGVVSFCCPASVTCK